VNALPLVLALVAAWCLLATRLVAWRLTAPLVFVAAGFALAQLGVLELEVEPHLVKLIAEVTLVLVLFADASKIRPTQVKANLVVYGRLLGIGLPLTVAAGAAVAAVVLGLDGWAALLVGAALAPTDAALGADLMSDERVPSRIRNILNVESGLNDGIVTPVVVLAIAGVAAEAGITGVHGPGHAVLSLVVGLLVGCVVGGVGSLAGRVAARHRWVGEELMGPAVLAIALLSYTAAVAIDGNGFVAAFVSGLAFGVLARSHTEESVLFVEQSGAIASMTSWLVFGALAVPIIEDWFTWQMLVYAVASLTVVRMAAVALSLLGSGLSTFDVVFVGWFGPRGLASVVFALLTLEDLGVAGRELVATVSLTVLLSVIAHGLSGRPLARRFARASHPA
jgi:NhaP-type Na+/H+ or K+/H+ antiporter